MFVVVFLIGVSPGPLEDGPFYNASTSGRPLGGHRGRMTRGYPVGVVGRRPASHHRRDLLQIACCPIPLCIAYVAMTNVLGRMLDRELKKGSAELLILSLLEARPRHGYEISKLIEDRSR